MKTSSPIIPSVLLLFGKENPLMTEITGSVFTAREPAFSELCEHKTSSHVRIHERLPGGQTETKRNNEPSRTRVTGLCG